MIQTEARNATLGDLAGLLKSQQEAKVDLVTPLVNVRSEAALIRVAGTEVFGDGIVLRPTVIADGQIADKLGIPVAYLRKLREQRSDLYDANVNGWIHGNPAQHAPGSTGIYNAGPWTDPDARTMLLRTFQGDPGEEGVLRAVLSDRYGMIDNFDVLTAALEGVRESGTDIEVMGCDLTETRMTVRIAAPEVMVNADALLSEYRSPLGRLGARQVPEWAQEKFGVDPNGVCAGLVLSNSETGGGAFSIVPRLTILTCLNGMMRTKDAFRAVHLGGKLEEGAVAWSDDTQRKALELITAKAKDAVAAFLDADYVQMAVDQATARAVTPVENPMQAIEVVAKKLAYTEAQREGILDHFIKGGQVTAGGVMQAVTSYAQTVESADVAYDLEASAWRALEVAAAL